MSKLTPEAIQALVEGESMSRFGTLTVCVLDLTNGAQVVGESNVIDPANYSMKLGEDAARANAMSKIWSLEGYAMKTRPRASDKLI